MFNKRGDSNAYGIHGEVAPEESVAEDEANEFDAAELVNPVGLIEFAELDGIGDGEAEDDQAACRGCAEDQAQHEEDRHCPQTITNKVDVEIG